MRVLIAFWCCLMGAAWAQDIAAMAEARKGDLAVSAYLVADHVKAMAADEAARDTSVGVLRNMGVTQVMLEVYRGSVELEQGELEAMRDYYQGKGFGVVGGIATVGAKEGGPIVTGKMDWFNYQNAGTRAELERICRRAAKVFDAFIVDDFLCTADESAESKEAKGEQGWPEYRRALMTEIARDVIVRPMKEDNPDITVIVKFPQWYDRFHLFGYDTENYPEIFDGIWVGTESRGRDTQRFGFTQPYEGYVNYRWLSSIGGEKMAGAWFDHGDCDAEDFIDQAWTTVLAGAKDIVLFQYGDLRNGHGGHELFRRDFAQLADLAAAVAKGVPDGVGAYKPRNSDPGGDMYIMDFVGMLGVPLVPMARFPEDYGSIFLPTQAAHDLQVAEKTEKFIEEGGNVVMTLGFLAAAKGGDKLAQLAGVSGVEVSPMEAHTIYSSAEDSHKCETPVDLEGNLQLGNARAILTAKTDAGEVPMVTMAESGKSKVFVLNTHTFNQEDFDKVGEMLLSPRDLGLMHIDQTSAGVIRYAFANRVAQELNAPPGVAMFVLREDGVVLQNHNDTPAEVSMRFKNGAHATRAEAKDGEGNYVLADIEGERLLFRMQPRERLWVKKVQ